MGTGSLCLVLALELAVVGWEPSSIRRLCHPGKSEFTDIIIWLLYGGILSGLFLTIGSLGLTHVAAQAASFIRAVAPHLDTGSTLANIALCLLLNDLLLYWVHRAFHSKLLWPIHRFHHSAERLNPLVKFRNQPIYMAFNPLIDTTAVALIASPWPVFPAVFLFHQLLVHSVVPWSWGALGRWVVVPPSAHAIHHSHDPRFYNRNFGATLIVWDRLFGTWASSTVHRAAPSLR